MSDLAWLPDWLNDLTPLVPIVPILPAFFFPTCECCGDFVSVSCSGCMRLPRCWELVVSGVTNDACTLCNEWNGTHVIKHVSDCVWAGPTFDHEVPNDSVCETRQALWRLDAAGSLWHLTAVAGSIFSTVQYDLDGEFDCNGPNVFLLDASSVNPGAACTNWPASLTITPTECPSETTTTEGTTTTQGTTTQGTTTT